MAQMIKYPRIMLSIFAGAVLVGSCTEENKTQYPMTLYRNSSVSSTMRIHFSTFNATDSHNSLYNIANCKMAARLLNANIRALNPKKKLYLTGFWCESGFYNKTGGAPIEFKAKYPTVAK